MRPPVDLPRAVRCPACNMRTRHVPFVKPACRGYGLLCARCGRVTQPTGDGTGGEG